MSNLKSSINLFRSRKKGFFEKFLKWALGIGRIVVILTETIALAAFLYRFSLDRQLIDLHEDIRAKQAIVNLLKNNEATYRSLQGKIALAKTLTDTGKQTTVIFTDIVAFTENDAVLNNIILSETQLKIDAQMQSVITLKNFINKLKSYPKITSVSIDRIENRTTSSTIIVGITAVLKKPTLATKSAKTAE